MKIKETTKPVERTFNLKNVTSSEMKVIRTALTGFIEHEEAHRIGQNNRKKVASCDMAVEGKEGMPYVPIPQSNEEITAKKLLGIIRKAERANLTVGDK